MREGRVDRNKMWSRSIIATVAIVFVAAATVTCSPVNITAPATELLPPEVDSGPTLATDLVPPPLPEVPHTEVDKVEPTEKKVPGTLFLINVYAVKNRTAEDSNDVLHDDVIGEVTDETAEPLAMFLLVVEDEDEDHPVSLDEVAKDLEEEGFAVEKVSKNGETRIVKVDLGSVETVVKVEDEGNSEKSVEKNALAETKADVDEDEQPPLEEAGKLTKIRRKRTICLKCKLEELKMRKFHHGGGGYGGGGCGGGCGGGGGGGGYYPQPVYQPAQPVYQPVVVVPVQTGGGGGGGYHKGGCGSGGCYQPQPQPQPHYQPVQRPAYPPTCNTCGGGGGYNNGGGNAHASAQASASASASSYSGY